jgi:glycosyltransferase involved in cell wall biosynthesis
VRVAAYPADYFACGHYRVVWPAEVVAMGGETVTVVPPKGNTAITVKEDRETGEVLDAFPPDDVDVIVLQRPARARIAQAIPFLRAHGVAVVVDVDDDLPRIHPDNPAWKGMHPKHSPDYNWDNVAYACEHATLVTVSTPALVPRYGPHGRVRVVRNYVPAKFLAHDRDPGLATVGWAGSLHSHPRDLFPAAGALRRLWKEGRELKFVGPRDGLARELNVPGAAVDCTGNLSFGDWQPALAARIGVGVAPLATSSFNLAKSWLKPLEYAAAGVPCVLSDTPEYGLLAKSTGATVARRGGDWHGELKALLDDDARRKDASEAARDAAGSFTVEGHAHEWAEAWEAALEIERRAPRA